VIAEQSIIKKIRIDNTDIFLEDFEPGKGKITVSDTYGHNYSYYWGAMGSSLAEFICSINEEYFARNLLGTRKYYVMDCRRTFANLRKYISKDMGLPFYKHMEFQKELREKINEFQRECEERPTNDHFVSMFFPSFVNGIEFIWIDDSREREQVQKAFNDIEEWWHFIIEKPSPEYVWLTKLHGKLKKKLSKVKK
jgi:hypothetical protein